MGKLDDLLSQAAWAPVRAWIANMAAITQTRAPYVIRRFCRYVGKTPTELLEWQQRSLRSQDRKVNRQVLRQAQAYVDSLDGTKSYKQRNYTDLISFFAFHDLPLASDKSYRIRGTRPQNVGTLTVEDLQAILTATHVARDYAMYSMILTQFQSFSGVAEICHINSQCANQIVEQLRAGHNPARIDLKRSRKGNERPWFTFIGADAIAALGEYFDKERGWPESGEVIWKDKSDGIMTDKSYRYKFQALARHVKIIPREKGRSRGIRYGKSPHELRDLARSLVHKAHSKEHEINREKLLFDAVCPEFWMGHGVDPLKYNEFWKHDPDGVRNQYLIAEKYLNIMSGESGRKPGDIRAEDIARAFIEYPELMEQIREGVYERMKLHASPGGER